MADYRTIGEAAKELEVPEYVLRFWETKFKQLKPSKRRGGRRFYSNADIELVRKIKTLLHSSGYTIKGANIILNNKFVDMNTPKKAEKPKEVAKPKIKAQPDLFGYDDISADAKQKLKNLVANLRQVQELLNDQGK